MSEPVQIGLAIIVDSSRTLTVVGIRPAEVHLAGTMEFPGGKVEIAETPEQCAVREALEETGLNIGVLEKWNAIKFVYPDRTVVLHPFLCDSVNRRELAGTWYWTEISELDAKMFPEANQGLIERLRDTISPPSDEDDKQ